MQQIDDTTLLVCALCRRCFCPGTGVDNDRLCGDGCLDVSEREDQNYHDYQEDQNYREYLQDLRDLQDHIDDTMGDDLDPVYESHAAYETYGDYYDEDGDPYGDDWDEDGDPYGDDWDEDYVQGPEEWGWDFPYVCFQQDDRSPEAWLARHFDPEDDIPSLRFNYRHDQEEDEVIRDMGFLPISCDWERVTVD